MYSELTRSYVHICTCKYIHYYFTVLGMAFIMDDASNVCASGGVEILGLHHSAAARNKQLNRPALEKYVFVPYQREIRVENLQEYLKKCMNCIRIGMEQWFESGVKICTKWRDALQDCLQSMKLPANTKTDDVRTKIPRVALQFIRHIDSITSNLTRIKLGHQKLFFKTITTTSATQEQIKST